ncbi:protease complex subunit PrcB family protein [Paludifilum halophilum]|uniref:protease complex subunit PrcB family protein n=1 Tax=Paludifilum halophilum TaxID=1642702 RepID=UPI00146BAC01|nr:protease complex subunit PrcB family protein [Paludifilum halophilum]
MDSERKGEAAVRLLTKRAERNLPNDALHWLKHIKQERGVHRMNVKGKRLLVVASGVKPNPGYRLVFVEEKKEGGKLLIVVREEAPEPGAMHPQVLAYPYLAFQIRGKPPSVIDAATGTPFGQKR